MAIAVIHGGCTPRATVGIPAIGQRSIADLVALLTPCGACIGIAAIHVSVVANSLNGV